MLKPKLYLLLILAICVMNVAAQDMQRYRGALSATTSHYSKYDSARVDYSIRLDTLILDDVRTSAELELFINKGAGNKIYAIDISTAWQHDLEKFIDLLGQCPNLKYLKFSSLRDRLPPSITKLQQLVGVEFSFVTTDMADALTKISALKNLRTLEFTDHRQQLPQMVSTIAQVTTVGINTLNIAGLDLSNANWQSAHFQEEREDSDNNRRALSVLANIKSLRTLEIPNIKISDTAVIDQFTQLTDLQIEGWVLKGGKLVNKIGKLTNLKHLELYLPFDSTLTIKSLIPLKYLTSLTISGQFKDEQAPGEIELLSHFKNLESLSLRNCQFSTFPDVFAKLPGLKRLSLADNRLTELPPSLFRLSRLSYLNVANNKLKQLPAADEYAFTDLIKLDLHNNELTTLPNAITRLNQLETLLVWGNELTTLPSGWQNLNKLKHANFSENKLTAYPPGLQDNHSIESISFTQNNISIVPDITGNGYRIKSLILDANPITHLPKHIGRYTELEGLNLLYGKLQSIPASLGDCKKLKRLVIDKSIVSPTRLPAGLKNAQHLEVLSVVGNPLLDKQSIFDVILSMPRKNFYVYLRNNNIEALPATTKWTSTPFGSLDLSDNKLKTLPASFADVKVLEGVQLSYNSFPGDAKVYYKPVKTKADMQAVFNQINIRLPDATAPKADRVTALLKFANNACDKANYAEAVKYANQARAIDSALYNAKAPFNEIGISRFKVKDYKGALKDLDRYIATVDDNSYYNINGTVWQCKLDAHIILNQQEQAIKLYSKIGGTINQCQKALILCKKSHNKALYNRLLDSTIASFSRAPQRPNQTGYNPRYNFTLPYAFCFIMANQPAKAIDVLKNEYIGEPYPYDMPQYLNEFRALLKAFANYLTTPANFNKIKRELQSKVDFRDRMPPYKYQFHLGDFDQWLPYSNFTGEQQKCLLELSSVVK